MHPEWNDRIQEAITVSIVSLYVGMYVLVRAKLNDDFTRLTVLRDFSRFPSVSIWDRTHSSCISYGVLRKKKRPYPSAP